MGESGATVGARQPVPSACREGRGWVEACGRSQARPRPVPYRVPGRPGVCASAGGSVPVQKRSVTVSVELDDTPSVPRGWWCSERVQRSPIDAFGL